MRRCIAVLGSLVIAVVAWASAADAESPVRSDNKPTPVADAENGRLPAGQLITVLAGCRSVRAAAPSLALLFRQATAANVALFGNDCYRPIDDQVSLYAYNTSNGGPCTAAPSYYPDGRRKGTSNHGWGKAVDFGNLGGTLNFSSAGYRFLTQHAARLGWNHPGWARAGQACAEPWHWEWVGDGGSMGLDQIRADVISLLPSADGQGYAAVTALGDVIPRGNFTNRGNALSVPLAWVVVGAAPTPDRGGYWLLGADGGIFTYGNATFFGSTGDRRLNQPVVTMAATPDGGGYWLAAGDGGMFSFGDATFHGSATGLALNAPVVGGTLSPTGGGYTLFSADGGAVTFGDATFAGSAAGQPMNAGIIGGARTPSGKGYWLAGADGGVYAFGDAEFHGSAVELGSLGAPIVSLTASPSGRGYWLAAADGGVFSFGDALFYGSAADQPQSAPVRALIRAPRGRGYWLVRADRQVVPFGTVDAPVRRFAGLGPVQFL